VANLKDVGTTARNKNFIHEEIESGLNLENAGYFIFLSPL
jgi:hypothetical protein